MRVVASIFVNSILANSILVLAACDGGDSKGDEVGDSSSETTSEGGESESGSSESESGGSDTGAPDLPQGCAAPSSLASALTITGEFPSEPWTGGCTIDDASVDAGTLSLTLTCTDADVEFPLSVSAPAEAVPSGVGSGQAIGVVYAGDHSDEFAPVQKLELDDIDGLILASVEASLQDVVFGSITLSVASECAEVFDPDSAVATAAGYVHASTSQTEADIEVGGVATLAFGFEWDVHVTEATAIQCCHGNQLSATIVRR
ncbi:hypothetical protein ACNOYE_09795 [Nannocystaceae bacterium ST9]